MDDFLRIAKDALNMDESDALEMDVELETLDGWDSLGKFMLFSQIFSDFGVTLEVEDVYAARTVEDLWHLVEHARQDA